MDNVKQEIQSHDCSDIGAGERKRWPSILRSILKYNLWSETF